MPDAQDNNPKADYNKQRPKPATPVVGDHGAQTTATERKNGIRRHIHWPYVWGTMAGIVALIGFSGIFYGVAHWAEDRIDKAVERKLSDPAILRKIAAESRPALVFDANESITSDMGAGQLVKEIHVAQRAPDGWPKVVTVDFSRFLANPPILTPLHDTTSVFSKRAKGFAWQFEIFEVIEHGKEKDAWLYRLELAP